MKLSYPIAAPDSHVNLMAFTGNFESNLDAIAGIGYEAVELLVRDPKELSISYIDTALSRRGLKISAIGTSPMQAQDGLTLLSPVPEIRGEALERTLQLIPFSAAFQAPVIIGKFRGKVNSQVNCTFQLLNEIFYDLCNYAGQQNAGIVMEPQKYDNVNNLNTISESLDWINEMKCSNLKLLLDTFHMAFTESDISESIRLAADHIGFVHLADSERLVPFCGDIDFKNVLKSFRETSYSGYYSLEIKQFPDSFQAAELSYKILNYISTL
ncbi:sugar phosphate isomerase/epimerase [Clostridium sp. AM58-1XD]|uniref:sugar phosphate isomerase/epimerase family protein n=1 Tax=Clostridium sp. AM58-1XD TaxID=2292307 RepID=UPI000E534287|nr:sugar phosphate isomerase/epimerase [Clostridium sp. AM58-1XD]RGZ01198.1 sugar phosphate isomerase/epimerase [Clostridium sp. AM58-1XD]